MSDKLVTRNGESVEINSVIEALETAPDKEEILEALKGLRADKVKDAVSKTVRAAQFEFKIIFNEYLADGEKSQRTVQTYRDEISKFTEYLERIGSHLLSATRADVNRFKAYLLERYAQNSVRLTLASCSSFYTYLEDERYIERSPYTHIRYPKREYKKAVKPDQGSPSPVMSEKEYQAIVNELEKRSHSPGKQLSVSRKRESAKSLLPVVHMMATYGLRIGDALTVRIEDEDRFSVKVKGEVVRSFDMRPETKDILRPIDKREPFKGIGRSTVQGALRRLTDELAEIRVIRSRYSAHDFRHFFAVELYRETHDVYAVKEALGHATVSITEVYLAGLGAG